MTSHRKHSRGVWVFAALAASCAALLTPAAWHPYRSHFILNDAEWAPEDAARALGRKLPPNVVVAHDPRAHVWKLSASAASPERAESDLAAIVDRLLSRREERRRRMEEGGPQAGPPSPMTAVAETAAELLAESRSAGEAARALQPAPLVVLPAAAPTQLALRGALAALDAERADAAAARDAPRLVALLPLTAETERSWARSWADPPPGESDRHAGRARAAAALRVRLLRRGLETGRAAEELLAGLGAVERGRARGVADERVRELRVTLPDPGELTAAGVLRPWVSPARRTEWPRAAFALALGLAGAVAGRAVAGAGHWLRRRSPGRGSTRAMAAPPESAAAALGASALHWVGGPHVASVTGAVYALAASAVERGERVLVVDASERLCLHRVVEREHRLGLAECVREGLPVLGLVQETPVEGLYLLARGNSGWRPDWAGVERILHLARPHFSRVVLGLDPGVQTVAIRGLAGSGAAGWWASRPLGSTKIPKRVKELTGNSLHGIKVEASPKVSLELARAAVQRRQAPALVDFSPSRERPFPAPAPAPRLDCVLHVRERLRFLAWVRQVAAESRTSPGRPTHVEEPAPTSV